MNALIPFQTVEKDFVETMVPIAISKGPGSPTEEDIAVNEGKFAANFSKGSVSFKSGDSNRNIASYPGNIAIQFIHAIDMGGPF